LQPTIFIGSSSEGLGIARAIKADLSRDAEVDLWEDGLFRVGQLVLSELMTFPYIFDAAILVLTPDDLVVKRDVQLRSPRDNVLFELGAFMSTLGQNKTFVASAPGIELPSDLKGLIYAPVHTNLRTPRAMVRDACAKIRAALADALEKSTFGLLPSTALARGYFHNFLSRVCSAFGGRGTVLTLHEEDLEGTVHDRPLSLAGRRARFVVVLPQDLQNFRPEAIQEVVREHDDVWPVSLAIGQARPWPFYTFLRAQRDETVEFFDIPTTLSTSLEAVDDCLPGVNEATLERVRRREVENFRREIQRQANRFGRGGMIGFADMSYFDGA